MNRTEENMIYTVNADSISALAPLYTILEHYLLDLHIYDLVVGVEVGHQDGDDWEPVADFEFLPEHAERYEYMQEVLKQAVASYSVRIKVHRPSLTSSDDSELLSQGAIQAGEEGERDRLVDELDRICGLLQSVDDEYANNYFLSPTPEAGPFGLIYLMNPEPGTTAKAALSLLTQFSKKFDFVLETGAVISVWTPQ